MCAWDNFACLWDVHLWPVLWAVLHTAAAWVFIGLGIGTALALLLGMALIVLEKKDV